MAIEIRYNKKQKYEALSVEDYKAIYGAIVSLSVDADGYGLFAQISDEDIEKCKWIAAIYEVLDDVPKCRMAHVFKHKNIEFDSEQFLEENACW